MLLSRLFYEPQTKREINDEEQLNGNAIWSTVLLEVRNVLLQQLIDAIEESKVRQQQSQQPCCEMNDKWIDSIWSAYKEKFDRTYDTIEDSVRCVCGALYVL